VIAKRKNYTNAEFCIIICNGNRRQL